MPDSDAKKLQNTIDAICDDCVEKQRAKMHELCR
jgi:hypothetical protein